MSGPGGPRSGTEGYGETADALVKQYESVSFADVHLRAHGQRLHPEAAITWIDDSLPDLGKVHARGERFDLIMLTAVWMHLDSDQREHAMARIAGLLQPGALVTLLLRHGPVSAGRRMFDVSATETSALAARHGLETVHDSERPALLGGSAVWWSVLALRAPA